jgi:hypothetical protein
LILRRSIMEKQVLIYQEIAFVDVGHHAVPVLIGRKPVA